MNLLKKIGRALTVVAIAPLSGLENKGRNRKLEERLKHLEEKNRFA